MFLVAPLAFGQSLWQPGFSGYLVAKSSLAVGDPVLVTIDTNTKLSYSASAVSDRSITLQFSGGGSGDLFSYLPKGTSGSKANLRGDEQVALSGSLMTRVQSVDPNGMLFVQGSRSMDVNGRAQLLSISGWVDPKLLQGRSIPFSQMADAKLVYQSILESPPVLTQSDINQVMQQLAAVPPGAPTPGGQAVQPTAPIAPGAQAVQPVPPAAPGAQAVVAPTTPATPPAGQAVAGQPVQAPSQPTYALTDQTKKELLLQYLNAILGLIFQPAQQAGQAKP